MARKAAKTPRSYEMMDLGSEPDWDDQHDLEDAELNLRFGQALNWYNYNYTSYPCYERKRIAGKKKVNAIKDGILILIHMIKLFFSK